MKWWHWPLVILGVLGAAILVMYAVGTALPAGHTATVEARLDAPPDQVWRRITDVDRYPQWRPDVERVTRLEDRRGLPVWREALGTGALTFETVARDSAERLVVRIADDDLPFGGSWTYRLVPADGGTLLTITEDGEVDNPLFRFLSRFVFGHESTIQAYLDALQAALDDADG